MLKILRIFVTDIEFYANKYFLGEFFCYFIGMR